MKFLGNLLTLVLTLVAVLVLAAAPWPAWLAFAAIVAAWLWLARAGRQARAVAGIGLRALPTRLGASLVIVIGIAGVVGVLVSLLAMAEGYRQTLASTGSADTAIVLRGGSAAEVNSVLDHDTLVVVGDAPGVARAADGTPLASGELVVAANLPRRASDDPDDLGSVQFRGVEPKAWELRPDAHVIAGRLFKPGLRELVVGRGAQRQFKGLDLGQQVRLGTQVWTVVGVFQTPGSLESEIWADAADVASAYRRGSGLTAVYVKLANPSAFAAFKAALAADPRLKVDALPTLEYYAKQSEAITKVIRVIGIVVGTIMAIGAVFGALNTMFAAVAARAREIATLRAVGFRSGSVVFAIMLETMFLALAGGLLGGLLARLFFDGMTASSIAGGVGVLSFSLRVTGALLWTGLVWALCIGFLGGIYPALRAARLPIATALRET